MRVAVLGGTVFIGVAIVEELREAGHDVLVIHRGHHWRQDMPPVPAVRADRQDVPTLRAALAEFRADAVVHTCAYSRADAEAAADAFGDVPAVVLSSMDTYRAFATVRAGGEATDPVPLDESSPVRGIDQRYPYRSERPPLDGVDPQTYEKLDVEPVAVARRDTVLRLPMVYGERDKMRREDFVLRRVRAGRKQIPIGTGTFLWSRGWVRDIALAARLAVETGAGAGQILNVAERRTGSMAHWARDILATAGSDAELVRVPDPALPKDLALTGRIPQHVLVDSTRARSLLGWSDTDPLAALERSVRWHLDHPPEEADPDLSEDEAALRAA